MSIPIIFVREFTPQGHFRGMTLALKSARKWAPDCETVLIADKQTFSGHPDCVQKYAKPFAMEDYSESKNELLSLWPKTDNPNEWFPQTTLTAWLVIADWAEKNNVKFLATLDTDVLCFSSMDIPHWRQFDFSACNASGSCPQAPSFVSVHALRCFRLFLLGIFSGKLTTESPIEVIKDQCKCCMSAWQHAAGHLGMTQGNLCELIGGATFDHSLSAAYGGYEHNGTEKVMRWIKGQPWCERIGGLIRFNNLHCWGDAKARMADYVKASEESLLT